MNLFNWVRKHLEKSVSLLVHIAYLLLNWNWSAEVTQPEQVSWTASFRAEQCSWRSPLEKTSATLLFSSLRKGGHEVEQCTYFLFWCMFTKGQTLHPCAQDTKHSSSLPVQTQDLAFCGKVLPQLNRMHMKNMIFKSVCFKE